MKIFNGSEGYIIQIAAKMTKIYRWGEVHCMLAAAVLCCCCAVRWSLLCEEGSPKPQDMMAILIMPRWAHKSVKCLRAPGRIATGQYRKNAWCTGQAGNYTSPGNQFSWTKLIWEHIKHGQDRKALNIYKEMRSEGVIASTYTFVAALKACSVVSDLEAGKEIHAHVIESGNQSHIFVATTLVDMYVKCGSMVDAHRVFDKMSHHDVVSWTAMIGGYAQMEDGELALKLYARMQHEGIAPNARTFVAALKACRILGEQEEGKEVDGELIKIGFLEKVQAIHYQVIKSGFESDIFVATALVALYMKCGSMPNARKVFEKMQHRDVASWNAMIIGYAQMEMAELGLQLYARMQHEGFIPNARTFAAALKVCSTLTAQAADKEVNKLIKMRCLQKGKAIHSQVTHRGFESDIFVATALIAMYMKCGSVVDARRVFEKMMDRNVVSWNTMIMGYAQMEMGGLALQLYVRMQHEGVTPDDLTFVAALKACGSLASLETGKEIHVGISRVGLEGEEFVANSLVDMYGKCGSMMDAQRLFDALPVKNVVTWNTLLAGYSGHGDSERVFELFERMQQEGVQPDGITLLSVLTVCSHTGIVDKGQKYFQAMCLDYGIIPHSEHYTCMVDLLGRAGQLDEAVSIVKKMPFEPVIVTWMTILGACRKWNDLQIGRYAFESLVRLDGKCDAAYLLMSNLYASACMLEESVKIEEMRMNIRPWKKPGKC